mgnify:CR=1 FL=1
MNTIIIDYDAGNVKSLQFALERLGVNAILTNNSELIAASDRVIFPGQGEAISAMKKLKKHGLDQLIPELVESKKFHDQEVEEKGAPKKV